MTGDIVREARVEVLVESDKVERLNVILDVSDVRQIALNEEELMYLLNRIRKDN